MKCIIGYIYMYQYKEGDINTLKYLYIFIQRILGFAFNSNKFTIFPLSKFLSPNFWKYCNCNRISNCNDLLVLTRKDTVNIKKNLVPTVNCSFLQWHIHVFEIHFNIPTVRCIDQLCTNELTIVRKICFLFNFHSECTF